MRIHPSLFLLCITALAWAALPARGETPQHETPVYYTLIMEHALFDGQPDNPRDLVVELERIGEHWDAAYGVARDYNMSHHRGAVNDVRLTPGTLSFGLHMIYSGDPYKPGGEGVYRVELATDADGSLQGSFEGAFNGQPVRGPVSGSIYAPRVADDHVPLQRKEHPRLLFRPRDVPALRERFATPFGQAARQRLEAANTPASLALLYQMTQDAEYVRRAVELAERELARPLRGGDAFRPMAPLGTRLEQLALLYDMAYDALSEDYKQRYRAWVASAGHQVYLAPGTIGTTNWHVVSNHVADVYAGVTTSALVLFDEPSEKPEEPFQPFLDETLPPAADFQPGRDVPVVDLTPGRAPDRWLHTQPLRVNMPDDPREVFYDLEKVRARPGTSVQIGDFELTFRQQDPALRVTDDDQYGGLHVHNLLEADGASRLREPFTMVAYTVVRVSEPGLFRLSAPCSRANLMQVAVNGRLLADGQVVRLEEGLYPLIVKVQWRMRWGHIAPSFHPATEQQLATWQGQASELRTQYEARQAAYQNMLATWQRTGSDPAFTRLMRLARFTSALHNEAAVGRGGFQAEVAHYSMEAMIGHARLWPAWRNVMGYDITPGREYADVIPRKIVSGPQDINGTTRIGGAFFAALFPAIRQEWQGEVLTAWHGESRARNQNVVEEVLREDPVRAFVNYPLGMEPAPLGTALPRQWQAPGFGFYALRSGWDEDAFIAQVFLKSRIIHGWNGANAGSYRLRGLGQDWASGPTDRVRRRQEENVVWLPEEELHDGARGRLTYLHMDEETMILSADLNEVYERTGRQQYTRYGNLMRIARGDDVPEPSGIRALRAIAFDFSGLSGAPCLYVVVDRIDGAPDARRLWLFQPQLPAGATLGGVARADEAGSLTVRPRPDGPSLRGRFAHPHQPAIHTEPLRYEYIKTWGSGQGQTHTVNVNAITVPGSDHYFFVATVTDGEHPPIHIAGQGLDAVVTVGNRTIRFDGEKVILQPAE